MPARALHEVYGERYWKSDSPKTQGYADYAADEELYLKTFRRRLGACCGYHAGPRSRFSTSAARRASSCAS